MTDREVVHRVEDGMDRQEIEATTYQMRNPFKQMRDGFFTALDVFNYMHHHHIAKAFAKKGNLVLDVCCGRGIMLPLLRYHAPEIAGYVGVDIAPKNAEWLTKRVTDGKDLASIPASREARPVGDPRGDSGEPFTYTVDSYYPFPTWFVESNVADMAVPVREELGEDAAFDLIIYTQSIEHMHPEAGYRSLEQCAYLAGPGCRLVLSGPNTPPDQDGYDARYRAHVYEWKREELLDALGDAGWRVEREWGLTIGKRALGNAILRTERDSRSATLNQDTIEALQACVPTEWLMPVLAPLFPEDCDEIAILATRDDQLSLGEV